MEVKPFIATDFIMLTCKKCNKQYSAIFCHSEEIKRFIVGLSNNQKRNGIAFLCQHCTLEFLNGLKDNKMPLL